MPTIEPASKVLVTGGNGYIALWLVRRLLEKGYSVRATVRSLQKAAHMIEYFKSYGDRLEVIEVEDITRDGAFDEAVKDVDAIEHTASPATFDVKTPQEMIEPAVNGTLGVLRSAQKLGTKVKRIVITSSTAAVVQRTDPEGTLYNDKSWNELSVRSVEEQGSKAHVGDMYSASKTLAEKAAWKFVEENKSTLSWDLVTLNVPWTIGPPLQPVATPADLNGSMRTWWNIVVAPLPNCLDNNFFITSNAIGIDVRDLADAHILSLEKEKAGGERFLVNAMGEWTWQDWKPIINSLGPSLLPGGKPVFALPEVEKIQVKKYDSEKVNRLLGIKWRSMEETARDIMEDAAKRGWLQ